MMANDEIKVTLSAVSNQATANVHDNPYSLQLGAGTGSSVPAVCDDFDTTTQIGETWDAHIFSLGDLSDLKFANDPDGLDPSNTLQEYEAALDLTETFLKNYKTMSSAMIGDYSFAPWGIFSSAARDSSGWTANALNLAETALGGTYNINDFIGWEIITPDPLSASQEYFVYSGALEPGTLLMAVFGLALILIGIRPIRRFMSTSD